MIWVRILHQGEVTGSLCQRTMPDLEQYDYELPRELIAQEPLQYRPDARLMLVERRKNSITHGHVRDLPSHLRPGDCLVINNSKVVPARLIGFRTNTGGRWQGLFLEADQEGNWRVMSKTRGHLEVGETITLVNREMQPVAELQILARLEDGSLAITPRSNLPTTDLLQRVGRVPLPPYIRAGEMRDNDRQNYQTVYARHDGSVAAPTAGLHFTSELLDEIRESGTHIVEITLHVGIGTFRPITVSNLEDHAMHSEWGRLEPDQVCRLNDVRKAGGRVIAVGTTSVRVLEWASNGGKLVAFEGPTNLFIRPPYSFRYVDAMMTNFHLPKSTLLVLVRTFGGDALIKQAYQDAIAESYRFYSYGDAMLIT